MINTNVPLRRIETPYVYFTADDVVSTPDLKRLNATVPDLSLFERCIKKGSQHRKEYRMWRAEAGQDSRPVEVADQLPDAWSELVEDALSAEFRTWLSESTGADVRTVRSTVGLYVFADGDYTTLDTGKQTKALSFGLYLNETWREEYGGAFQVFAAKTPTEAPHHELMPVGGRCVTMVPADTTWHRIEQVHTDDKVARLLMMVEFWRD